MDSKTRELIMAINELRGLVRRAQDRLSQHLEPSSDIQSSFDCVNDLLEMFDGPEQRRIEAVAQAAIANAERT